MWSLFDDPDRGRRLRRFFYHDYIFPTFIFFPLIWKLSRGPGFLNF